LPFVIKINFDEAVCTYKPLTFSYGSEGVVERESLTVHTDMEVARVKGWLGKGGWKAG
jgi:hypothetical protein